ncbi:transient receptor potential-gamma protein-like [Schistocerca cancellata]|uniref:transient receptor potential-gamma protein-like n=1 Tax=Schistocerca cancellata TaxID=274614 RepID=UPI002119273C|nr:transient receptor potential-gamma protein-like [Schistocerca cancellata]
MHVELAGSLAGDLQWVAGSPGAELLEREERVRGVRAVPDPDNATWPATAPSECRPCVRRMLQRAQETAYININCVDPLGRSALLMAIDNENLEMVELLIEYKVETKDALLHAISEEFVEAVEVLLDHEETLHRPGEPHSWEALPPDTATFTPDITPLILSAHRDNYEIIKILLDRGATLPMPHDVR